MQLTKQTQLDILKKYDVSPQELKEEIQEFIMYWKEKSPNWKKERWQKEKTFDPNLRLHRWLRNKQKRSNRVIVNSEDEERKKKLAELEEKKKNLFSNF